MFVDQLVENEKKVLMYLLVDISKADGNFDKKEMEFLTAYSTENGTKLDLEREIPFSEVCK